ncbi:hypothetical protein LIER_43196 [Lithospermum erythrorhizon]|uniref:Uncharacterized protein n=1 Tax=Lithospermum erythrorhizon TaxID=34254 RepID=A0AAV3PSC4_LITER
MVNSIFAKQIGRNMEIYVDDMIVKSKEKTHCLGNLRKTFEQLRNNRLWINLEKCLSGVTSGKFLGYMISERGTVQHPDKIKVLLDMKPPESYKDVQNLTGCLTALNRFISKSEERNMSFFKNLRRASWERFRWDDECVRAFEELKEYLGSPKLLSRPETNEELQFYLAVSDEAVSSVLIREGTQKPIYYVSHVLHRAEGNYQLIDTFAFAVVISARKLMIYFEYHPIKVITDQPLKKVLASPAYQDDSQPG